MDWARILAFVAGMVDQELLARIEYLALSRPGIPNASCRHSSWSTSCSIWLSEVLMNAGISIHHTGSATAFQGGGAHASRRWITDGFLVRPVRDGRFQIPECGLLIPPARAQAQPLGEILEQPQLLYVATPLALVISVLGLRC